MDRSSFPGHVLRFFRYALLSLPASQPVSLREDLINCSTRHLEWNWMKGKHRCALGSQKALRVVARIQRGFVARWSWMFIHCRALFSAVSSRLGSAQSFGEEPPHLVQGHRPGLGRAGHRPQATRHARRHPRHLGRRVRPHRLQPGCTGQRARPPRPLLQ